MKKSSLNGDMSLRGQVKFSERIFDVKTLPADLHRVYKKLERNFGEEYALTFVFIFRTGVELHRAWHMTLLTSKVLQQVKEEFSIRMTWELGVTKLIFHVEDGLYELRRKVPYDYDSEYQDLYMKVAVAYVDGYINIHQALNFQSDIKKGKHTAASGLFLRDFPGRLLLYPFEAATCTVIFFSGDWHDAGVAAVCGIAAGLVEYLMVTLGGNAKILIDVLVGTSTGAIAGIFYRYNGQHTCMSAVFLGTLYWFFYGTAFVLGILEILAGELGTGVTRFMAVSVKTFVLSLGTTFGMRMTLENSLEAWQDQGNCGIIDLDEVWWRIPLYLACSASALGQYRFPINSYWRGLIVQLAGYEVQYQLFNHFAKKHSKDLLDTAYANIGGAVAAVVVAFIVAGIVDSMSYYYNARVLQRCKVKFSPFGEFMFSLNLFYIRFCNCLGFGKKNDNIFLNLTGKLKQESKEINDPNHSRTEIVLTEEEEKIFLEAIVEAEYMNIWALLMPTVYQLVPGSLIAKLWFNAIFPPPLESEEVEIGDTGSTYTLVKPDQIQDTVFESLMVVSTSLALGLLVGFGVVSATACIFHKLFCWREPKHKRTESMRSRYKRKATRRNFDITRKEDDPDEDVDSPNITTMNPISHDMENNKKINSSRGAQ